MSSLAPSKREHPTNTPPSRAGLLDWLTKYATSTVGQKFVVALTGTALVGFVIAHMAGNLQIFAGREKLNEYALFLKNLGPMLWAMRIGLLVVFVVHILLTLSLKKRSSNARPIGYVHSDTIQASFASVTMVWTGLLVLAFTLYHLAHFTFGWTQTADGRNFLTLHDPKGHHDVYEMVIAGFRSPVVAIIYLIAQAILFVHLSHGIGSVFQTLGLNTPRTAQFFRRLGFAVAGVIFAGNCSIVVAVWTGMVH
ncbi:MAG: succinate dehydrogenase cytochrome b subunit [Planctomycetes bacterium]|nr:succinate dehydrogenase cytochrome b subunit [Planctomycetota bacterium]